MSEIVVTGADRDAADAWLLGGGLEPNEATLENILSLTIAFSRHRIAATAELEAEVARLRGALGRIKQKLNCNSGPDAVLQCWDMASEALSRERK